MKWGFMDNVVIWSVETTGKLDYLTSIIDHDYIPQQA